MKRDRFRKQLARGANKNAPTKSAELAADFALDDVQNHPLFGAGKAEEQFGQDRHIMSAPGAGSAELADAEDGFAEIAADAARAAVNYLIGRAVAGEI